MNNRFVFRAPVDPDFYLESEWMTNGANSKQNKITLDGSRMEMLEHYENDKARRENSVQTREQYEKSKLHAEMTQALGNEKVLQDIKGSQGGEKGDDSSGLKIIDVWSEKERNYIQSNQSEHQDNISTSNAMLTQLGSSDYEHNQTEHLNHAHVSSQNDLLQENFTGVKDIEACTITNEKPMENPQEYKPVDSFEVCKNLHPSYETGEFNISERELEMDIMQDLLERISSDQQEQSWSFSEVQDNENRRGINALKQVNILKRRIPKSKTEKENDSTCTLMSQAGVDNNAISVKKEEQVWCVCKSASASGFIISCDKCKKWYHGLCIGIDEKKAQMIDKFICIACKGSPQGLATSDTRKQQQTQKQDTSDKTDLVEKQNALGVHNLVKKQSPFHAMQSNLSLSCSHNQRTVTEVSKNDKHWEEVEQRNDVREVRRMQEQTLTKAATFQNDHVSSLMLNKCIMLPRILRRPKRARTKQAKNTQTTANEQFQKVQSRVLEEVPRYAAGSLRLITKDVEVAPIPFTADAETAQRPVTYNAETVQRPVTNNAETAQRPVTKDAETAQRPVTNDAETAQRPVTNNAEMALRSVTNSAETAQKPVTKDAETALRSVTNDAEMAQKSVTNSAETAQRPVTKDAETAQISVTNGAETASRPILKDTTTITAPRQCTQQTEVAARLISNYSEESRLVTEHAEMTPFKVSSAYIIFPIFKDNSGNDISKPQILNACGTLGNWNAQAFQTNILDHAGKSSPAFLVPKCTDKPVVMETSINFNSISPAPEHKGQHCPQEMDSLLLKKKAKVQAQKTLTLSKHVLNELNPKTDGRNHGDKEKHTIVEAFEILRQELPRMDNKKHATRPEILDEAVSAIRSLDMASIRLQREIVRETRHQEKLNSKLKEVEDNLQVQVSTGRSNNENLQVQGQDKEKRKRGRPRKDILPPPSVLTTQSDKSFQRQGNASQGESNDWSREIDKEVNGDDQMDHRGDKRKRKMSAAYLRHIQSERNLKSYDKDSHAESDVDSDMDPDYQPVKGPSCDADSSFLEDSESSEYTDKDENEMISEIGKESGQIKLASSKSIYDQRGPYQEKIHACLYCNKMMTEMASHLKKEHHNEALVQRILKCSKRSKERRVMWQELISKGDYCHNMDILKKGSGTLIPKTTCKDEDIHKLVPCPYCKGLFKKRFQKRHRKMCLFRKNESISDQVRNGDIQDSDSSEEYCDSLQGSDSNEGEVTCVGDQTDTNKRSESSYRGKQQQNNVHVQTSHYKKKHACLFCGKVMAEISRHLRIIHSEEAAVSHILKHPKHSKERKILWLELVNKGDFSHNLKVLDKGEGMLIPKKRCKIKYEDFKKLVPCQWCKAFYVKSDLYKHSKTCVAKGKGTVKNHVRDSMMLLPGRKCSKDLERNVLCTMRDDEITKIVKSDERILQYGERISDSNVRVSQKLRELGRVVLESKKLSGEVCCIDDLLKTENWDTMIKSVKIIAGYNSENNRYAVPSFALKIGSSLHKCAIYLQSQGCTEGDETKKQIAESFLTKYEKDWNSSISEHAVSSLEATNFGRSLLLPLVENMLKLINYLRKEMERVYQVVKEEFEFGMYFTLAQMCLSMIILFNRKRSSLVEKMKLKDFQDSEKLNGEPEPRTSKLSEFERKLCKTHTRIEVMGKRGGKEVVLFTKETEDILEFLISNREKANVLTDFLFPKRRHSKFPYSGNKLISKFAIEAGVQDPSALISSKFKKQVGTITQILSMDENSQDIFLILQEYGIEVHQEDKRLPEDPLHIAKVVKVLNNINNVGKETNFRGIKFEDVQLGKEETLKIESESSEDEEVQKLAKTKGKGKKHRWTIEEKKAVAKYFKEDIEESKLPGMHMCLDAIKLEPCLRRFGWVAIKAAVRNLIKKKKLLTRKS
ncbi:hypothetical protein FSP39_023652 [Pinctada imbricata]|uniref:PHD-type domain-containing protein n=1 Tax=Pinctada imbricata TaxID=66713 RepID=A0AA89C0Z1_PINIB|nr:hypothetical protein FSP39_023652 [Pinctada imbricata]